MLVLFGHLLLKRTAVVRLMLCSRAALDTDHCLGVDAGPDGWRRVVAILLDGIRAPGRTPLEGPAPQAHRAG